MEQIQAAVLDNVVVQGCVRRCPCCKKTKELVEFGLRKMGNGIIRNQSWCKACRAIDTRATAC